MGRRTTTVLIALCTGCALLTGCALRKPAAPAVPTLAMHQGSLRMSMDVDSDGFVRLSEFAPLLGRLEVAPILDAEDAQVTTIQLLQHLGRYYIAAEGFRNLWEVSPQPGTTTATYRSIRVSATPLAAVRLGRYGPPDRPCVRLDSAGGGPWYLTVEGDLDEQCS